MKAKDLTTDQREWFVSNFADTKNQELADRLGTSVGSVNRMARELGLCKSGEFMSAMQRNAIACAARANRATGGNVVGIANLLRYGKAYRFKAGVKLRDRMSEEAYASMLKKHSISLKETYRKERRRVLFGLEQQTDLRVVRSSRAKMSLRYNLRKHGYVIGRGSSEAMVTDETLRSVKMEERARGMGINFNF